MMNINESKITNIEQCAYQRHPPQKIESSLYQDFHVLYVHIERDKKQEGNESEKLSQFCCRAAHQKLRFSLLSLQSSISSFSHCAASYSRFAWQYQTFSMKY